MAGGPWGPPQRGPRRQGRPDIAARLFAWPRHKTCPARRVSRVSSRRSVSSMPRYRPARRRRLRQVGLSRAWWLPSRDVPLLWPWPHWCWAPAPTLFPNRAWPRSDPAWPLPRTSEPPLRDWRHRPAATPDRNTVARVPTWCWWDGAGNRGCRRAAARPALFRSRSEERTGQGRSRRTARPPGTLVQSWSMFRINSVRPRSSTQAWMVSPTWAGRSILVSWSWDNRRWVPSCCWIT